MTYDRKLGKENEYQGGKVEGEEDGVVLGVMCGY